MDSRRLVVLLLVSLAMAGCGGSDTAPSTTPPPTTAPPPSQTLYTLTGQVTVGASNQGISGATVTVADGVNAGKSATTDGSGRYTLGGLTFAGFSVSASAQGYDPVSRGVPLSAGVTTTTANFSLLPSVRWSRVGSGNTVFDMPTYISRVRIVGTYNQHSSNFIVRIGGRLVVNELLGTSWQQPRYEGVHLTTGGTVEITNSSGVQWSFVEER
jgi:hypothetical protein